MKERIGCLLIAWYSKTLYIKNLRTFYKNSHLKSNSNIFEKSSGAWIKNTSLTCVLIKPTINLFFFFFAIKSRQQMQSIAFNLYIACRCLLKWQIITVHLCCTIHACLKSKQTIHNVAGNNLEPQNLTQISSSPVASHFRAFNKLRNIWIRYFHLL